jgi:hypothetical protein
MRSLLGVISVLFLLIGIGFAGQGLGFIPGSYMTGRSEWAAIGGIMVAGGVLGLWWLSRPRAS